MPTPPDHSPMTLGNMRANGVRWIMLSCPAPCHHMADVPADGLADDVAVPHIGRRFRCKICGRRAPQSRPAWHLGSGAIGVARGHPHPD